MKKAEERKTEDLSAVVAQENSCVHELISFTDGDVEYAATADRLTGRAKSRHPAGRREREIGRSMTNRKR